MVASPGAAGAPGADGGRCAHLGRPGAGRHAGRRRRPMQRPGRRL